MTKRKMPVKTVDVDLTEGGYPGFTCERWLNTPFNFFERLENAKKEEESRRLLLKLFPAWDLVDEDGEPIPHSVEGFGAISGDLLGVMMRRGSAAVREAAMPANLDERSSSAVEEPATA